MVVPAPRLGTRRVLLIKLLIKLGGRPSHRKSRHPRWPGPYGSAPRFPVRQESRDRPLAMVPDAKPCVDLTRPSISTRKPWDIRSRHTPNRTTLPACATYHSTAGPGRQARRVAPTQPSISLTSRGAEDRDPPRTERPFRPVPLITPQLIPDAKLVALLRRSLRFPIQKPRGRRSRHTPNGTTLPACATYHSTNVHFW